MLSIAIYVLMIVGMWKLFEMAGKPGWASIVPIYNIIVVLEIIRKPIWWIVMFMIPLVNIYFGIMTYIEFAKAYGKGTGFGIGLLFLPFIFFPLLAFSKDTQYVGVPEDTTRQ